MKNILVVEDTSDIRFFLRRILTNNNYSVHTAENGEEALKYLYENYYDIIITDILMPVMDGITLINKIRSEFSEQPIIIVLTALVSDEVRNKVVFAGADEYITKPIGKNELLKKVEVIIKRSKHESLKIEVNYGRSHLERDFFCIGIASSTGGPQTLSALFKSLGKIENSSFLITQHGPRWMLESYVKSLRAYTKMPVYLGENGMEIKPGSIYIAPGDSHMILGDNPLHIELIDSPPENYVKPSADPMFRSIAETFNNKSVGIILTGMGHDGSIGAGYISVAGGKVIAQDPDTCILSSMPSSVINLNLADFILPISEMPGTLKDILSFQKQEG